MPREVWDAELGRLVPLSPRVATVHQSEAPLGSFPDDTICYAGASLWPMVAGFDPGQSISTVHQVFATDQYGQTYRVLGVKR